MNSDLRATEAIRAYWKQTKHLPISLNAIPKQISGSQVPDPISKRPYKYVLLDQSLFRLCARFDLHETGKEFCFWRTLMSVRAKKLRVKNKLTRG